MSESRSNAHTSQRKRLRRWLTEGLVFLLVLYLLHLWQTRNSVDGTAPPLDGQLLDGRVFSLQSRPQRPLLIYFWASWCPVCGLTSGNVDSLAEGHEVITVAMQSGTPSEIASVLAEKGLHFPVITDPTGEIANSWGVSGVPAFFILDRRNRIRFVSVGYTSQAGLALRLWLSDN
jgi:peroxiredoxin